MSEQHIGNGDLRKGGLRQREGGDQGQGLGKTHGACSGFNNASGSSPDGVKTSISRSMALTRRIG